MESMMSPLGPPIGEEVVTSPPTQLTVAEKEVGCPPVVPRRLRYRSCAKIVKVTGCPTSPLVRPSPANLHCMASQLVGETTHWNGLCASLSEVGPTVACSA